MSFLDLFYNYKHYFGFQQSRPLSFRNHLSTQGIDYNVFFTWVVKYFLISILVAPSIASVSCLILSEQKDTLGFYDL